MRVSEDKRYSREYLEPDKRSIANAVQVIFKNGEQTEKVEVEYPAGYRRRRAEGMPLLVKKARQKSGHALQSAADRTHHRVVPERGGVGKLASDRICGLFNTMNFTYYGHACFAVEIGNRTLLFDPFISGNPLAAAINPQSLKADYILVSHGHADHLADAVAIAKRTGATIIAPYEVAQWLSEQGAPKTHGVNHGGGCQFDFGRVKLVNAIHSSSLPDGSYGGNPGGFVVQSGAGKLLLLRRHRADARHGIDRANPCA